MPMRGGPTRRLYEQDVRVVIPRARQSTGPLSSRAGLESSWLERQWQTEVEVRSETQPDHGGALHRANLISRTQWMQKRPTRQRRPRQQARPPCVRTFSECPPAAADFWLPAIGATFYISGSSALAFAATNVEQHRERSQCVYRCVMPHSGARTL